MIVNWSVDIGNLLAVATFLITGTGVIYTIRESLKTLVLRVNLLESEVKKLSEILVALGRQEERLTAMDRRIDDLRRGKGFVLEDFNRKP